MALLTSVLGVIGWHLLDEATVQMIVAVAPGRRECEQWAEQLREAGLRVWIRTDHHLDESRRNLHVPPSLAACHTAVTVQGRRYVVEGHVPARAIKRLLDERPDILGLSVPGPPPATGSGSKPPEVWAFTRDGQITLFGRYPVIGTETPPPDL